MTWEGWDGGTLARELDLPAVELHPEISSTSDRVGTLLREGAPAWTAVLADAQTAGRGRRGRGWASPPGLGVWLSLALPGGALEVDALLPLRVGSALAARLQEKGCPAPQVKWPNDLLLPDRRKVAGILMERVVLTGGVPVVILGVGVNVLGVDPSVGTDAGALADVWPGAGRRPVLAAAVQAAREARAESSRELGPEEMERWSCRDALLNREVTVTGTGQRPREGTVRGVDPRGRLLLETDGEVLHLVSGTVRVRPFDRR